MNANRWRVVTAQNRHTPTARPVLDRQFNTSVLGLLLVTQAAAKHLPEERRSRSIPALALELLQEPSNRSLDAGRLVELKPVT